MGSSSGLEQGSSSNRTTRTSTKTGKTTGDTTAGKAKSEWGGANRMGKGLGMGDDATAIVAAGKNVAAAFNAVDC